MSVEQKLEQENNPLKTMRFLSWRVSKGKEKQHRKNIEHRLFMRDRQREVTMTRH